MAMVQIRRDPFARSTLMRGKCQPQSKCNWCGQPAKFHYWWENDSSSPNGNRAWTQGIRPFCSIGCWEAYHG